MHQGRQITLILCTSTLKLQQSIIYLLMDIFLIFFSGNGYVYEDDGISINYQLNNNSYNNFSVSFTHVTTE